MRSQLFGLALILALAGCKDSPTQPATNQTPHLRAQIDGLLFQPDYLDYSLSTSGNRMRINGAISLVAVSQRQLTLDLVWKGKGTYDLGPAIGGSNFAFVYDTDVNSKAVGEWYTTTTEVGTVTVTEFNAASHWVAGTFGFRATSALGGDVLNGPQMNITQGTFAGYYFVDP